jgi:TetR/AcrR family transcriptional repressor of lmrAB and yxaGH operons
MEATESSQEKANREQKPSRERFLDAAAQLFQRQGYAATGLNEITARSGAPKGSLYFHFPGGKEQLGAEALTLAGERFEAAIRAVLDSARDTPSAIRGLAAAMSAGLEATDYQLGCPVATTALEAAATSESIAAAAHGAFYSWLAALTRQLLRDGLSRRESEQRATLILSALEGALILARAGHSTEPLKLVSAQLATICK